MVGDSGNVKTRAFCPTCGSPVYLTFAAMPDLFTVHAASLDDPGRYKPQMVTVRRARSRLGPCRSGPAEIRQDAAAVNPATLVTPTGPTVGPKCSVTTTLTAFEENTMTTAIANISTVTVREPSPVNHPVVSRQQWLAERKALQAREKELTRLGDQIARERRALPWVRMDKDYVFDTPPGPAAAGRPVRRPPPARGAALHARPGLGAGLQELLLHGRPHRRHARAPGAARHQLRRRLARAARRDRALPPAHGLEVPLGVLARHRLQPRLPRQLHAPTRWRTARPTTISAASRRARRCPASASSGRTTRARSSTPTRPTAAAWR